MEAQGLVIWLLGLLFIRAMAQQCLAYQSASKQITAADAAKTFALEWRMEATAHISSLMVRDQQCKGDPTNCDLQEGASDAIETLSKWAVGDKGWERLLSSVSLYAIARHAYQEAEYDEAIIALEESLALRLFAYTDQKTLDRWQQGLVTPGSLFRRQKMDLANTLVLRSDCLVQLAREQRDVDDLTEAMELLQLATALLKGGDELVPDSVAAISRRAATIASVAAELLPQLKTSRVREVLEHHGIACSGCSSKGDYLVRLVPLLRLPVRVASPSSGSSSGSSSKSSSMPLIEPLKDPFNSHATALLKKPHEHVAQYMQRVFFRLLTLVPADYLAELEVACRRQDAKGRCISYLPLWVTAQAITIDKRTGMAHVSGPGACAGDGTGVGDDPTLDIPPDNEAMIASAADDGGSCASLAGVASGQLHSKPFFVPGDAAGGSALSEAGKFLPTAEPHNRAGLELCGFLHIRAIPPGVTLPTTGGSLTPQQQKVLKDKAAEGVATGSALNSPFKGVYYYFYTDIPALVDRIINTFDPEEADFLFEQLDALTNAKSLNLAGRMSTPPAKDCTEQALLEGKASPTCSVLVPNIGSCAKAPLKPPRRRIPMDPIPVNLGLPPTVGSYTPRMRARAPPAASWNGQGSLNGGSGWGDGSNGSGDRDGDGLSGDSADAGSGAGRSRHPHRHGHHHHHHHHGHFPLTDRELSDRQLQEQMVKLARDAGRRDRDDPLVPLTLAGCAVASFGLYLASKRRRRGGSSSSSSGSSAAWLVLLGLGTGRLKGGSSSCGLLSSAGSGSSGASLLAAGSGAGGSGTGFGDGTAADGDGDFDGGPASAAANRHKRLVAAALRVAMNNTDTGKLESALAEAEAADLGEAGLLQRARAMLDKRRKKDQIKAAAEKAKLRAQKKEEARKGRRAAAKLEAEAAAVATAAATQQQISGFGDCAGDAADAALLVDTGGGGAAAAEAAAGPGKLSRLLHFFGLSRSSGAADAGDGAAAAAGVACSSSPSRTSSGTLSRASSVGAGLSSATSATAAVAAPASSGKQRQRQSQQQQQQQQLGGSLGKAAASGSSSRSSSLSDASAAGGKVAAAAAASANAFNGISGRSCNSHPISTEPSGSSADDACSIPDASIASPTSPGAAAGSSATTVKPPVGSGSKKGKGRAASSTTSTHQQQQQSFKSKDDAGSASSKSNKVSVDAVSSSSTSSSKGSSKTADLYVVPAGAAAAVATPVKAAKQVKAGKQQQAALVAATAGSAGSAVSPAKRLQLQQQQQQQQQQVSSPATHAGSGVTPPVTPPATAATYAATAASAAARGAAGQYGISAMHVRPQQQQQQQQQQAAAGGVPSAWTSVVTASIRQAAVSDDGSSSTSSLRQGAAGGPTGHQQPAAGAAAAAGTTTPSKAKLNPRAAPYQPTGTFGAEASKAAAAAAAASQQKQQGGFAGSTGFAAAAAAAAAGAVSPGDWRSSAGLIGGAASGPPPGFSPAGVLPMRGPSPTAGSAGGVMLGDGSLHGLQASSRALIDAGLMLGANGSSNGIHPHHLQHHFGAGLGPADATMEVGGAGAMHHNLISYHSADGLAGGPGGIGFDQGLTSPNHHHPMDHLAPALSPQQHYGMQQHQHMQQQQQLLELLSAAGPGESRYGGIASAGGSAPVGFGPGSSMDAFVAARGSNQRSSYSSVPDYAMAHMQAAGATGQLPGSTARGGRGVPPGFDAYSHVQGSVMPQNHSGSGKGRPAALSLNIDDDQLPPGFSAEDYSTQTPSSSVNEPFAPPASMGMAAAAAAAGTPSPGSIPTTAPLGVFAGGSSVWAPLAATAGSAASSVAASVRSLWPSPLTASAAAAAVVTSSAGGTGGGLSDDHHGHHGHHGHPFGEHSYSRSQDLDVEVAAAATSTNVAELVLGTSPCLHAQGGVEAQMNKLAQDIMAIVAE